MAQIHLYPESTIEEDNQITTGFSLEYPSGDRQHLWYRLPADYKNALSDNCDPYLIASIFRAMETPANLYIHGSISPSLLRNLSEFQTIWKCWLPDRYTPVEIIPDSIRETERAKTSATLALFSRGVDSSHILWRYRDGLGGRLKHPIKAGLMLHGFDIQIRHRDTFKRAFTRAKIMLDSLGLDAISMAINLKSLGDIEFSHGALLVSCLMLLQGGFDTGIIASSMPYFNMTKTGGLPYGSNTLTDEMLSSESFNILNIGSEETRIKKIYDMAVWPEAFEHLRVCLGPQAELRDGNCCRCLKCIRNILAFRSMGLGLPPCFEEDVSNSQLLRMNYPYSYRIIYFNKIIEQASVSNTGGTWTRILRVSIIVNQIKMFILKLPLIKPLRQMIHRRS